MMLPVLLALILLRLLFPESVISFVDLVDNNNVTQDFSIHTYLVTELIAPIYFFLQVIVDKDLDWILIFMLYIGLYGRRHKPKPLIYETGKIMAFLYCLFIGGVLLLIAIDQGSIYKIYLKQFLIANLAVFCSTLIYKYKFKTKTTFGPSVYIKWFYSFFFFAALNYCLILIPVAKYKIETKPGVQIADLHNHTWFSDAPISVLGRVLWASLHGVNTLAISDHNSSKTYQVAKSYSVHFKDLTVFEAQEMSTRDPTVHFNMYCRPSEYHPKDGVSDQEYIIKNLEEFKNKGGFITLNHFYPPFMGIKIEKLYKSIDGIEIENSWLQSLSAENRIKLVGIANKYKLFKISGSDNHQSRELRTFVTLQKPATTSCEEFFLAIQKNKHQVIKLRHKYEWTAPASLGFLSSFIRVINYYLQISRTECFSWIVWLLVFFFIKKGYLSRNKHTT